jgi:hypothetical protein
MAISRHSVGRVVVEVLSLVIAAEEIPDGPARLDDPSSLALLNVTRRETYCPGRKELVEPGLYLFHGLTQSSPVNVQELARLT